MTDIPYNTPSQSLPQQIANAQAMVWEAVTNYTNNPTEENHNAVVQSQNNHINLTGYVFADNDGS